MEKGLSKSRNDVKKSPSQAREVLDVWSFLPQEVVRLVFTKLNAESLFNTTFVCKSWSQVARDKRLIQDAYKNSKEFKDVLFKLQLKLSPKKFKALKKNQKLLKFLKVYHQHSFRMLKFLSNNFAHEAGFVNEDALRALIYISWFSGTIVDIIKQLIVEAMEQLKIYVTLGNAPRDAGNSLASDARFFILKRNSLENLTIIFYQRMIAHNLMEYVLSSHIEAIMKEYNNVSLMREEGVKNIIPLLDSLVKSMVQSAPLFPQELSDVYAFYEDNIQKLTVDKEKIKRGLLTSRLLILRLFVPSVVNMAKTKGTALDRLSLFAQIANVLNGISVMATDEANSSEDKFKSTLIQAFCKERVESMAHFLEQIMTSQKEKATEIRSEPDPKEFIEQATLVFGMWEESKGKLETSLKVQYRDIYDEYKLLETTKRDV
jgi:hypothetical protein